MGTSLLSRNNTTTKGHYFSSLNFLFFSHLISRILRQANTFPFSYRREKWSLWGLIGLPSCQLDLVHTISYLICTTQLDSPPKPAPHQPPNGESPSPMGIPPKLPKFPQVHVHWINDAIQQSHPLSPSSPSAFNLSQHKVFSNELVVQIRWPKYWSFSMSHIQHFYLDPKQILIQWIQIYI